MIKAPLVANLSAREIDRMVEASEKWHAPSCDIDAGGACIAHSDMKEAWIEGYLAATGELGEREHYCPRHGWWHCTVCYHHPLCLKEHA